MIPAAVPFEGTRHSTFSPQTAAANLASFTTSDPLTTAFPPARSIFGGESDVFLRIEEENGHVFEIVGYNLMRGLGVGNFVRSRTFSIGGYDCHQKSMSPSTVYLELMSANAEAHLSDIGVSYEIDVPSCDIPEHFAELLDEKVGADIFEAHKAILAA
ncbi:hypothetical protein HU200_012625 [Digitaria exilis]|uniref:Uncharacterized protein n=1 Tax=Digitaria exilis TaxID=1010633 RepID=A0A835FES3_9POAL|nr:hypothetical protein HU200_012625 [Digitaria exilis]